MNKEDRFESIWVDLTEFGFGVRKVPVVWPEDHQDLKPDSVGSDEIIDGSIESQDLSDDIHDRLTPKYDEQGEGIRLGGL